MKLGHIMLGVLFFSGIMIMYGNLITDLNTNYNLDVDDGFKDTYDKIAEIGNITDSMTQDVVGASIDDADPSKSLSIGMLSSLKIVYQMPGIIISFFKEVAKTMYFGEGIMPIILTAIMLIITLLIISTVFGFKVI